SWDTPMTINPLASARRFEPYEVFFAGKVGLAVALDYAASIGMSAVVARNEQLSNRLRSGLSGLPGVAVHDKGIERSAIVTFAVEGCEPAEIQRSLRAQGINVSTTSVGSARLDFPERGLRQLVRASVHYFNTHDEIDALVSAIDVMSTGR
ncbi:MAG: aminotransferase class V-fold PLP-dependent enzyme, partial [Acidimicrobiia bacterium]